MTKAQYRAYLKSPEWAAVRARYLASPSTPKTCVVCGDTQVHLHHRTYFRVGRERLVDLVPLCRAHHADAHRIRREEDERRRARGKKPVGSQSVSNRATARQLDYIRRLGGVPRAEMTKRQARKMYERLSRAN